MKYFKQVFSILLVIAMVFSYMPNHSFAQDNQAQTQSKVTLHEPESSMTKGKDLPPKKGGGTWLWALLGAALIGGIIAAAGGGGGGGDGDDGGGETGDVDYAW